MDDSCRFVADVASMAVFEAEVAHVSDPGTEKDAIGLSEVSVAMVDGFGSEKVQLFSDNDSSSCGLIAVNKPSSCPRDSVS